MTKKKKTYQKREKVRDRFSVDKKWAKWLMKDSLRRNVIICNADVYTARTHAYTHTQTPLLSRSVFYEVSDESRYVHHIFSASPNEDVKTSEIAGIPLCSELVTSDSSVGETYIIGTDVGRRFFSAAN